MVYIAIRKRKVIGGQIHETLEEKRSKVNDVEKHKDVEEQLHQIDSKLMKEIEREKVESECLVPEVKNWVETEDVRKIKERVKRWLSLKYPVHIIGPTGCGKTILALEIAKELGRPTAWINGDESINTTDLIGGYSQVEVNSIRDKYVHNVFKDKDVLKAEWVDNPLTIACKYGYTLIYNEFSRSKAVANNVLLSIFSEGILELPTQFGEERYIKVHPNFRAIFTSNSIEYAGIHRAQDALLDRMVGIYMDYYNKETETKIIMAQSSIEEKPARLISDMLYSLRKKSPGEYHIGTRAGVMIAQGLKLTNMYDKKTIEEFLTDLMVSKTKSMYQFKEQAGIIKKISGFWK